MQKREKYIALLIIFAFVFYSSGQALLLHHCDCHDNVYQTETKQCCCENEETMDAKSENCHLIGFSFNEKLTNPESKTCHSCSVKCMQPENFDAEIPTVYYQMNFELQKNLCSKIKFDFYDSDNNDLNVKPKQQDSYHDFIPNRFGKSLLIKINSLKIPAHIS